MAKLTKTSELKVGDFLCEISYIRVTGVQDDECDVEDVNTGKTWTVSKSILETQTYTSNQYNSVEKVTRTELARILEVEIRDKVFSVCFTKMPNVNDQERLLEHADLSTPAKRKKVAKELMVGEERIMHAYAKDTHDMGRLPVFDVEARGDRLIDLRTIKWLVFANKRYELK